MDALSLLVADHNRVKGLFARFSKTIDSADVDEAAALVKLVLTELTVHATIEEELLYPAVHDLNDDLADTVDESVEEHHVAKVLVGEIAALSPGDHAWTAKMKVLIENVEHHVEEEEGELFPSVRSATDRVWREELGSRLEARKASLGAPTLTDKMDLSKEELSRMASEQEIPGRSLMDKEELAATVGIE
jgi:hemerythrin superfamily protein